MKALFESMFILAAVLVLFNITVSATGEGDKTNNTTFINGKVIDKMTNESLAGVKINIEGTDYVTLMGKCIQVLTPNIMKKVLLMQREY